MPMMDFIVKFRFVLPVITQGMLTVSTEQNYHSGELA